MRMVTLTGMPGSGKSAVGRIIAARLEWGFLDTDKLIEERHGVPLQELVDRVGDLDFRRLEEETVLSLPETERTVVATGGSAVYSEPAMRHLASISVVVFLDASLEAIRRHIDAEAPRGIVGMGEGGLEQLYRERLPFYRRFAALTVDLDGETPEEAAAKVLSELEPLGVQKGEDR